MATRALVDGRSCDWPRGCSQTAGLRSRRQPGELVPRLRSVLRGYSERQEFVRRRGAAGGAETGDIEEADVLRGPEPSRTDVCSSRVATGTISGYLSSNRER